MGGSDPQYMREYRDANDTYVEKNRNRSRARYKAQKILSELHPIEYEKIRSRQGTTSRARTILAEKYPVEYARLFNAQLAGMRNRGMVV